MKANAHTSVWKQDKMTKVKKKKKTSKQYFSVKDVNIYLSLNYRNNLSSP